jgi:hypothetical protein
MDSRRYGEAALTCSGAPRLVCELAQAGTHWLPAVGTFSAPVRAGLPGARGMAAGGGKDPFGTVWQGLSPPVAAFPSVFATC